MSKSGGGREAELDKLRRVCLDPRASVVVEACAGSGKTWLLTSRILRAAIEDPKLEPSQILAITFTNAAAAEIDGRLRERMIRLRDCEDKELDRLLAELMLKPSARLRKAARSLYRRYFLSQPKLAAKTFHGWFLQLERSLPWSQRQTLASRVGQHAVELVSEDAWIATLEEALADAALSESLSYMLARHKPPQLKEMLDTLLEKRVVWELFCGGPPEDKNARETFLSHVEKDNKPEWTGEEVLNNPSTKVLVGAMIMFIDKYVPLDTKDMRLFLEALKSLDASEMKDPAQFVDTLIPVMWTKAGGPRKRVGKWLDEVKEYSYLKDIVLSIIEHQNWLITQAYNRHAIALGACYASNYARLKEESSLIDFADIELTAMRALSDARVAAEVVERQALPLRHILVDEFQDTSPSHWQILHNWLEVSAGSGDVQPAVFVVGDPKQSIFSFQGGDPQVMVAAREYLESRYEAVSVKLNTTRRCAPAVIEFVNELFGTLEDNQVSKLDGFTAHDTSRIGLPGTVIALQPRRKKKRGEKSTSLRNPLVTPRRQEEDSPTALEGRMIAGCLGEVIGHLELEDGNGGKRLCREEDVMLLHPSRSNAVAVHQELARAGMPSAGVTGSNRLHDLECQDMIALLLAICEPHYGLATAQLLRSPVFGVDDDDLQLVNDAGGGDWLAGIKQARGSKELERAQLLLSKWRAEYRNGKLPAHEMLAACYQDADIIARYVRAVPRELGKRVVRNLEWLLNFAIEADNGSHVQVAEYADHLRSLSGLSSLSASTDAANPALIRSTTVHGAKGLEAPVVVVSNAAAKMRAMASAGLLLGWENIDGLRRPAHLSFFWHRGAATKVQLEILEKNEQARRREQSNLLYVALTRAKQVLLLSSASKVVSNSLQWADWLEESFKNLNGSEPSADVGADDEVLAYGDMPTAGEKARRDFAGEGGSVPQRLADPVVPAAGVGFEREPPSRAAQEGELLHGMLVLLLSGVSDDLEQQKFLSLLPKQQAKLRAKAEKILAGEQLSGLLKQAKRVELELPVLEAETADSSGGRGLRYIDCLIETAEEVWIIDFKSAQQPDPDKFRGQLERYRDALLFAGEKKPLRLALVGGKGLFVELEPGAENQQGQRPLD